MGEDKRERSFGSGELARIAGVSSDTLRHYERVGVLPRPPRTGGGYRRYPPEALERVRMVRQALAVGFSLPELARFLKARERGGVPCREVRALAATKLEIMERQLCDLKDMRNRVRTMLKDWDKRLASTPRGKRAGLLDSLAESKNQITIRKGVWR
jgi:DNA-binding transcriptional MerR regulator